MAKRKNVTKNVSAVVRLDLSEREKEVIKAGGKLAFIKTKQAKGRSLNPLIGP